MSEKKHKETNDNILQQLPEDLRQEIETLQKQVDKLNERVTIDLKLKRKG